MPEFLTRHRITLAALGGIATLAAVVLWIAPAEATLGQGVKLVFIHGALLLTGMLGLYVAGIAGIVTAVNGQENLARWMLTIGWVGFVMYVAGLLMSVPAGVVNWGGVYTSEPRVQVAMNGIALGVIVLVSNHLLEHARVKGVLFAAYAVYLAWSTYNAPMVLHPANPIGTSPSRAIQFSFAALLLLCIAAAAWIVWRVRHKPADESVIE